MLLVFDGAVFCLLFCYDVYNRFSVPRTFIPPHQHWKTPFLILSYYVYHIKLDYYNIIVSRVI